MPFIMNSPVSNTNAYSYEAVPTNIPSQKPDLSPPNSTPVALPAENVSTAVPQWNVNVPNNPSPNQTPIEMAQPVACVYNVHQAPPMVNMSTPQWNVNVPNNPSQETHLGTPNQTPMESSQPVGHAYNLPHAPPMVNMSPAAPQWNIAVPLPQEPNAFHQTFLKARPLVLGLVLMVLGIISLALGMGMIFVVVGLSLISGNPFWGALAYLITARITLATHSKPSICLVKGSLAMNILSSLMSGIGIVLACLDLAVLSTCITSDYLNRCPDTTVPIIVTSLALINNAAIFSVSLFIGVNGCVALNGVPRGQQVFLVQNGAMVPYPASSTTSQPLTQYPAPYFVQAEVKNQPTVENMQSH